MIERFVCRDFRNLGPLEWHPGPGAQVIFGANGAGKTSLLEALYLLATSRSFRGARPAECCRRGAEAFFMEAEVAGERRARLGVGWSAASGLERLLNGKPATPAEHLAVQPVVSWSAADAELLDGPPLGRRRLLDQGVVASRPAALGVLTRYRQALEQKRRLLAEGIRGLGPWNELLASAAAELTELRRGPHRDDLEVLWQGRGLRRAASAGEKKLLGLALTAARGRLLTSFGRDPLYLLDDADGDLDRARLEVAWELFSEAPQLVATSHRPEAWEAFGGAVTLRLEDGRLRGSQGA